MIQLYTFPWGKTVLYVLIISLILMVLTILYKKLQKSVLKNVAQNGTYTVLYALDKEFAEGEIEIYFTLEETKEVKLMILDDDLNEILEVENKEFSSGGNIVRFDTSKLKNGNYFYCLKTANQKTMKKMNVKNV